MVADQLDVGGDKPGVDTRQRAAVRFIGAAGGGVAAFAGKRQYRVGRIAHSARNRNLGAEFVDRFQIVPDCGATVAADGVTQRFRVDEGITVAVATNPCAEPDKTRRPCAQRLLPAHVELGQSLQKHFLHIRTGIFDLVGDDQFLAAKRTRLPKQRDLPVDRGVDIVAVSGGSLPVVAHRH